MRVFSNINPNQVPRVWCVGGDFEKTAAHFLPQLKTKSKLFRQLLSLVKITKGVQANYDVLMLKLHDQMKMSKSYQADIAHQTIELPAQTSWMVFTDQVPHAVLSGQFCLEQTFHFPVSVQSYPERSPLQVLERLMNKKLAF